MKEKYIVEHKQGGWQVMIWHNSKNNYLGLFKTVEEAKIIRDKFIRDNKHNNLSRTYNSYYFDNKEAYKQIIISQAEGRLDNNLFKSLYKIVKGVSKKFRYNNEDDRLDCQAYAVEIIIRNWHNFDPDRYDNVMAYFTEVIKRAFAMQFKQLQKTRLNTISLDYKNEEGETVFNI